MAHPTFGSRSLQDDNYYTESVNFRNTAPKDTKLVSVSRRPGAKITSNEHIEKRINLKGWVKGDDASDLKDKIDDLHQDLHEKDQTLVIETGRSYTANLSNLVIPDIQYNQTIVPFEAEFVCADPFASGTSEVAGWDIPSGTHEHDITFSISGTAFAEPAISYTAPGTNTSISGITIKNMTMAGEKVTWSGGVGDNTIDADEVVTFNYKTYQVQLDGDDKDHTGKFSRFDPGTHRLIISFSGGASGGSMELSYAPRYY